MGLFDAFGGAALGGIIGAQGTPSSGNSNSTTNQYVNLQDFNNLSKGQSGLEANTYAGMLSGYGGLQNTVAAGGNGLDQASEMLRGAYQYQNLLGSNVNAGGAPTQQQQQAGQNFAQSMFAPQQTALRQQFIQENQQGARLAASLGRSGADPILQAKLATQQGWEQQQLNAQQGQLAAQSAIGFQQQQMQAANQLYTVQQNLASQAFNNRAALLQMGNQLNNSERSYRIQTAQRSNSSDASFNQSQGGGPGQMLSGALSGLTGISGMSDLLGMGSGSFLVEGGGTAAGEGLLAGGAMDAMGAGAAEAAPEIGAAVLA